MNRNKKMLLSAAVVMTSLVGASYYAGTSLQGKFTPSLSQKDGDKDLLTDAQEFTYGTDPKKQDTDGDGLADGIEVTQYSTDPLNSDSDSDGATDGGEVTLGTLPKNDDSDEDSLKDGEEIRLGTDPLDKDTDDDGLSDGYEVNTTDTNPLSADTNGNGISDLEEY